MKICPKCGAQNTDTDSFCNQCGENLAAEQAVTASVEPVVPVVPAADAADAADAVPVAPVISAGDESVPVMPAQEGARKPIEFGAILAFVKAKAKWFIGGAAAIILIIILANVFSPKPYAVLKHSVSVLTVDGDTQVVFDNKKPVKIDGKVSAQYVPDRTAIVYTNEDDELFYLKKGGKPKSVAKDVGGFMLSENGKRILYQSDDTMYVVDTGKTKGKSIGSDIRPSAISPDGKALVYVKDDELYLNTGKEKKLDLDADEVSIGAVSNKGSLIYYTKDSKLYVMKPGKDAVTLGSGASAVEFNRDKTQLLYKEDGDTYLSVNGKEGVKVLNKAVSSVLTPSRTIGQPKSLKNALVYADGSIYRLGKDSDASVRISRVGSYMLSQDGKTLVFSNNSNIYRATNLKKESDSEPLNRGDEKEVQRTAFSRDGKKVYYVTDDGDLRYVKGKGKPKKVTSDVSSIYMSFDNATCFLVKDGELYASKNGGKANKVKGLNDEVNSVSVTANSVIVQTDDAYYRCTGGAKFTKLFDK